MELSTLHTNLLAKHYDINDRVDWVHKWGIRLGDWLPAKTTVHNSYAIEVTSPKILWGTCSEVLSEHMEYRQRRLLNYPTLWLTDTQKQGYALVKVDKLMRQAGKTFKEYPGTQHPDSSQIKELGNRLLNEEITSFQDLWQYELWTTTCVWFSNGIDEQKFGKEYICGRLWRDL